MSTGSHQSRSSRIFALDYLRGFFISVIIVDHLWRWPNLFQFATGRGELWVSAAEGFIIISGLLVGYVHGYKKRTQPLAPLSWKLIKRGIMLYVWMWITTLALVAITWNLAPKGGMAYIPVPVGDWKALFDLMLAFNYAHSLTYFLYLYAIYLVVSPGVILLLRRGFWWIVLAASGAAYWYGLTHEIEWLQWQVLFFGATTFGYHFDALLARFRALAPALRTTIRVGFIASMLGAFIYSMSIAFAHDPGTYTDPLFTRRPLSPLTIPMAFCWFLGLLSLFSYLMPLLKRYASWLLIFGERSLTAYILHTVPLVCIQLLFAPTTGQFWINTVLAALSVASTWALMKIPYINHLVPR
ncbi:MAG: OpgC domain-containing protein [Candidatus Saccharibacteria bacterium]|nr:OpgC domain-containing protein [Candidatus Saccharibacteria bacterium]